MSNVKLNKLILEIAPYTTGVKGIKSKVENIIVLEEANNFNSRRAVYKAFTLWIFRRLISVHWRISKIAQPNFGNK